MRSKPITPARKLQRLYERYWADPEAARRKVRDAYRAKSLRNRPLLPDLPGEEWRPIDFTNGAYSVSNMGRIKNLLARQGTRPGQIMNPPLGLNGHRVATLRINGVAQKHLISHLVGEAFLGPKPTGHEINHKNFDPGDNRVENIEWVTRSGNLSHYHGRYVHFLTPDEVQEILRLAGQLTHREIAARFGVARTTISKTIAKHQLPLP